MSPTSIAASSAAGASKTPRSKNHLGVSVSNADEAFKKWLRVRRIDPWLVAAVAR